MNTVSSNFDHGGFGRKVKRFLSGVPLATDVVAMYFCMMDPDTPLWVKALAASALGYFMMPMDAIPDVLLGVGMTDDMAVFASTLKAIAGHLTAEHYDQAREWLNS
jgi:uncharacterized membrane protein YkvA (DUF1232 family)